MSLNNINVMAADAIAATDLVVVGRDVELKLGAWATGCALDMDYAGTATITVSLSEQEKGELARETAAFFRRDKDGVRRLSKWNTLNVLGTSYVLREIARTPTGRDLVFYDEASEDLKRFTGPVKISRGRYTRAQFIGGLCNEAGVKPLILDPNVRQPIADLSASDRKTLRDSKNGQLANPTSGGTLELKGKGTPKAWAYALLRELGMEPTHKRVQVIEGWSNAENRYEWHNPMCTTRVINRGEVSMNSAGVKKYRTWADGVRATAETLRLDAYKGIMKGLRDNDLGEVYAASSEFNTWGTGAAAISNIKAAPTHDGTGGSAAADLGDTGGSTNGKVDRAHIQRFEFSIAAGEDFWDGTARLAGQVRWRRFAIFNYLVYASDFLLAQADPYEFSADDDWVDDPGMWRVTSNQRIDQLPISGRIAAIIPPGTAFAVKDDDPTYGTWLVRNFKRDLMDTSCAVQVTLGRAIAPLAEPASTVKAATQRNGPTQSDAASNGTLRERIIAVAEATMTVHTGYRYYWQGTLLTNDPTPPQRHPYRSDCSQWVRAVYLKAGAPDPGLNTWAQDARGKRTSKPKPGDLLIMPDHVELYIGNGRTIGHGTPTIDYARVSDFTPRNPHFVTYDFLDK